MSETETNRLKREIKELELDRRQFESDLIFTAGMPVVRSTRDTNRRLEIVNGLIDAKKAELKRLKTT